MSLSPFLLGILASAAAGAATGLGASAVFFMRKGLGPKTEDGLLSLAAGVMLAATFFSLLLPGLDFATEAGMGKVQGAMSVILGLLVGAATLASMHHFLPHDHFVMGHDGPDTRKVKQIWLFIFAITFHNIPEGMSVGIGFAADKWEQGLPLAFGIGLQNIPEGLAVAAALLAIHYRASTAFFVSLLTGLLESVGGVIGTLLANAGTMVMPVVMGIAAGAMLFVISDEIIPETHRRGNQAIATHTLIVGFCLMMFLDTWLGG